MKPIISVIVPVYNAQCYLNRCVSSLLGQSLSALEIILVDDGSTDESATLCANWERRDDRVHVLHQANQGVSAARNAALDVVCGEYIGFVDADDWVEPNFYDVLLKMARREQTDATFCGYCLNEDGAQEKRVSCNPQLEQNNGQLIEKWLAGRCGYGNSIWNGIYRSVLIQTPDAPLRFDSTLAIGEDQLWLIGFLLRCRSVAVSGECLYHYFIHGDSADHSVVLSEKKLSEIVCKQRLIDLLQAQSPNAVPYAKSQLYSTCNAFAVWAYMDGNMMMYREMRRLMQENHAFFWKWSSLSLARKIRRELLDVALKMGLPSKTIEWVNTVARRG